MPREAACAIQRPMCSPYSSGRHFRHTLPRPHDSGYDLCLTPFVHDVRSTPPYGEKSPMSLPDKIARSLFVALAVGLGWGIRGDFGHLVAQCTRRVLALGLCYVSGQRSLFLWMPILAALAAMGIGSGGRMSYALLHGYAQSDTLINYTYGFVTLFLQGSAWAHLAARSSA